MKEKGRSYLEIADIMDCTRAGVYNKMRIHDRLAFTLADVKRLSMATGTDMNDICGYGEKDERTKRT